MTNTGPTTLTGDIGVNPGSAITGLSSITVSGATHAADAVALQAQSAVTTAYNVLASSPCTQSFTGTAVEVGGQTLTPGVYCYSSSAQLTGTLTLDGGGVFIFKTASTLTTAASSSVNLIGGAQPCNVFWQIGSSADLFTDTTFAGNILALTSINLQHGTSVSGRALARNGAVTMDTNTVSNSSCTAAAATTTPNAASTTVSTASPVGTTATPLASVPTVAPTQASSGPPPTVTPRTGLVTGPNTGDGGSMRDAGRWLFVVLLLTLIVGVGLSGGGIAAARRRR